MKKPKPWNTGIDRAPVIDSALVGKKEPFEIDLSFWKTWIALVAIALATVTGFHIAWSLLFLFWIFISIKNKELFFVERVSASEAPITFWTTIAGWLFVSLYVLWEFFYHGGIEDWLANLY